MVHSKNNETFIYIFIFSFNNNNNNNNNNIIRSLLTQNGKLALLVNVFADASFTRRNEFVFRHKEAVRLATAIEYFIEKFMRCIIYEL